MPDTDHTAEAARALHDAVTATENAGKALAGDREQHLRVVDRLLRVADVHARLAETEVQRARLDVDRQTLDVLRAERLDAAWRRGVSLPDGDPARGHTAPRETRTAVCDRGCTADITDAFCSVHGNGSDR